MKNIQRAITIAVVVIVLGGAAWWGLQQREAASSPPTGQTPSIDTSDWKTYRNEQYGFEMKYPPIFSDKVDFNDFFSRLSTSPFTGNSTPLDNSRVFFIGIGSNTDKNGEAKIGLSVFNQRINDQTEISLGNDSLFLDQAERINLYNSYNAYFVPTGIAGSECVYFRSFIPYHTSTVSLLLEGCSNEQFGLGEMPMPSEEQNKSLDLLSRQILSTFKFMR